MKRLNVTLVVEEDLLREARAVAARRRTSVNAMVREFLKNVVSQESRRLAALEHIRPLLDRNDEPEKQSRAREIVARGFTEGCFAISAR